MVKLPKLLKRKKQNGRDKKSKTKNQEKTKEITSSVSDIDFK